MTGSVLGVRRAWVAVLVGLVWAQGCIAVRLVVLPNYVELAESIQDSRWYRIASWTLLAPITLASRLTPVRTSAGSAVTTTELSLAVLLLCPLLAVVLCLSGMRTLSSPRWWRWGVCILAAAGLLGVVCATAVALQLRDAALAEKAFFAIVSRVDEPSKDAATVSAVREFTQRHPDSRWAGEALRIVAMAEWDAGHVAAASELWGRFASRFRNRIAPGVAYAEYNTALCDERLGNDRAAQSHLRAAIEIIRCRGDGIQGWIATDAAQRLSVLKRLEGRYALAGYWKTKSRTFADVYSTE